MYGREGGGGGRGLPGPLTIQQLLSLTDTCIDSMITCLSSPGHSVTQNPTSIRIPPVFDYLATASVTHDTPASAVIATIFVHLASASDIKHKIES